MKEHTSHATTSVRLDERKLLLLMAAKGITNYKELGQILGLSENTFRVGFSQNQGYFGKRVYAGLCLLFGCTLNDLRLDAPEIVKETPEDNTLLLILRELQAIRTLVEVR